MSQIKMGQNRITIRRTGIWLGVIALVCVSCWILAGTIGTIWYDFSGPSGLTRKAYACLERGDCKGAIEFANRAVKCRPEIEMTLSTRATVLEKCGDLQRAVEDYTKITKLRSSYLPYSHRGRFYENMGELDKAAADYCTDIYRVENVRSVALNRVRGPFDDLNQQHPDAVPSLLKFINEAIARNPENRDLRECREVILKYLEESGVTEPEKLRS